MALKNHFGLPAFSPRFEVLMIFLASLCNINSYNGEFVFDDSPAITTNLDVTTTELSKIFRNDFWGNQLTHKQSHRSYRPLTILTFRFHHWLKGHLDPVDFHILNLILHSAVCLSTYLIFRQLFNKDAKHLAFYAAGMFAVHPVHCEAVSGIVGRADILCTLFVWLSLFFYSRSVFAKNIFTMTINQLICIIFITIAMFCKETGITAIGICIAYEFIIVNKKSIRDLTEFLSLNWLREIRRILYDNCRIVVRVLMMGLTGIILVAVRFSLMGFSTPTFQPVDNPASFLDNIFFRHINYQYIYSLNAWLLICPEWLCFDWSMGCVPLILNVDPRLLCIFLTWATIILLLKFNWTKYNNDESRYVLMGLSMLVIPFLPASNIFFNVGFVIAERTLYLPSAGYCLILVVGLQKLCLKFSYSKIPLAMYAILIITWFARSWTRSEQWKTERSLFHSALDVCPLNAKVHYNVAKDAADLGNIPRAEAEYRIAIRLHPKYAQAMNNLGNLLKDQERYYEAEKYLKRALRLQPDFAAAWMNLGIVLSAVKKFEESEEAYRKSLTHRPKCPDCHYNLGLLYMEKGDFSKAFEAWTTAIGQKMLHRKAWSNLIRLMDDRGMTETALVEGQVALKLFPDDAALHLSVANIMGKLGHFAESEAVFKTALNLDPMNPSIYTNLGVLYHRWEKPQKAEKMYKKALEINPNSQSARENLKKVKSLLKKKKLVKIK